MKYLAKRFPNQLKCDLVIPVTIVLNLIGAFIHSHSLLYCSTLTINQHGKTNTQNRYYLDYNFLVNSLSPWLYSFYKILNIISLIMKNMLATILIIAGLLGFAIFFKAIDFFDKI